MKELTLVEERETAGPLSRDTDVHLWSFLLDAFGFWCELGKEHLKDSARGGNNCSHRKCHWLNPGPSSATWGPVDLERAPASFWHSVSSLKNSLISSLLISQREMRKPEVRVKICCQLCTNEYIVTMVNSKLPLNNLQVIKNVGHPHKTDGEMLHLVWMRIRLLFWMMNWNYLQRSWTAR